MTRLIRVLCLHGWRTSGSILQRQTSALRQAFGPKAELVCVDAPWAASGPAPELVRSFYGQSGPFYQWWDALKREGGEAYRYEGFEHSLDYLVGKSRLWAPWTPCWASPRGGCSYLVNGALPVLVRPRALEGLRAGRGFYPRNPETQELLDAAKTSADGAIDVPSVHVIGRADPLAPKSEKLLRSFTATRRVRFEHEEGHKFPSPLKYAQMYHDIAQEVLAMTGQVWR